MPICSALQRRLLTVLAVDIEQFGNGCILGLNGRGRFLMNAAESRARNESAFDANLDVDKLLGVLDHGFDALHVDRRLGSRDPEIAEKWDRHRHHEQARDESSAPGIGRSQDAAENHELG